VSTFFGGGTEAHPEGPTHSVAIACTIVETDDRLGRLRNRIVDHEHNRIKIAGHTEGGNTIFTQLQLLMNDNTSRMAGINVVADKRHKSQVGTLTSGCSSSAPIYRA
jgi:hypothetical protein